MKGFSKRINIAMAMSRHSQSSLAKCIRISQPEISNYCRGKNFPRLEVIQKLSFELNVNYNWLKTGQGLHKIESKEELITSFHSTFQERLIWLLWKNRIDCKTLAGHLGFSSSTAISYWCEGDRTPNQDNLEKLSTFFNIDSEWLAPKPDEFTLSYKKAKELGLSKTEYLIWKKQNNY
jgi:transcriptional regulator with XRE-family HTH domain